MRILVVDDDNISRLLLRKILEHEGHHQIVEASSGESAWDLLKSPPLPALCLLDLMMPGIAGLHLLQKIRSEPRLKHIKVIVCTAINERKTIQQAASLEISAYLLKPFTAQKILQEVQKIQSEIGASEPLFDPSGTRQRLGIDVPFFIELLQILARETDQNLARMLTSDSDALPDKSILIGLNGLKGSSTNLGALALRNAIEAVETAYSIPQQPQLSSCLKHLAAENKRLKSFISQLETAKPTPSAA